MYSDVNSSETTAAQGEDGGDSSQPRRLPSLATARLRLRRLDPLDTLKVATITADPAAVAGTLDAPSNAERDHQWGWIAAHFSDSPHQRSLHWAVSLLGDDRIIGYTGLDDIDADSSQAELSFWFEAEPDWTQHAAEAAQAALAFAFTDLHLNRVCAFSLAGREQPAAVLATAGLHALADTGRHLAASDPLKEVVVWETSRAEWISHLQD